MVSFAPCTLSILEVESAYSVKLYEKHLKLTSYGSKNLLPVKNYGPEWLPYIYDGKLTEINIVFENPKEHKIKAVSVS